MILKLLKGKKALFRFIVCIGIAGSTIGVAQGQVSQELKGVPITNYLCGNNSDFPIANAFDGNINTYYMSCAYFGNWIGMDLAEKHVITKIAYCPRVDSDYRDRLQLGIFEGANNSDFSDAIPLFIIPGYTERELTEQEIVCTRGFRYVRFVFPTPQIDGKSSYMGEMKFFGYKGAGNDSKLPQLTNLPTISIKTVNNADINSKTNYIQGVVTIVYDNGTKVFTENIDIRGRGNASWGFPKKPYRMKLNTATQLMGLPARARNWTLINNYGDKTLIRNTLAFDFSRRIEMPYTSPSIAVDVVVNGDYKGNYQLCDHIDVRRNRVDVEEMTDEDLTGGYLLEIDAYYYTEAKYFFSLLYSLPVTIKYPDSEDITPQQTQYITNYFRQLTDAVYYYSYADPQRGFGRMMDIESFLRHFLVGEYSGNTDTYWSVYMSKKYDAEKFIIGPVWDFDIAFENDNRTYQINTRAQSSNEWLSLSPQSSAAGNAKDFVRKILSDNDVRLRMSQIYAYYRDRNAINKDILLGVVDSCATHIRTSQDLNFKRWPILNTYVHQNPAVYGSFDGEINNVKNYIRGRIDWMDQKLGYVPGVSNGEAGEDGFAPKVWTVAKTLNIQLTEPYAFSIYYANGAIVRQESLNRGDYQIPLETGFYIVTLTNGQGKRFTFKSIVP